MPAAIPPIELESGVRSYSRSWPAVFDRARGSYLYDQDDRAYLDFFTGAGTLNYGHNNPVIKQVLIEYLMNDHVVHSLDMFTSARNDFIETFVAHILRPRGLDHLLSFPGPGGTNAVEAALKLARKVKGRQTIVHFTHSFHGMTLGALAVTGNSLKRGGAGVALTNAVTMPFDGFGPDGASSLEYFEQMLRDSGSGLDTPAAVIVEVVQGEGGLNVASNEWLRQLEALCRRYDMLLIVDDIQAGCGRTGTFFSFEDSGIVPDMILLSKSLSGYGLPMALTLLRPELDVWAPGEHNGTFRGFSAAFATAAETIRHYWTDTVLSDRVAALSSVVERRLLEIAASAPGIALQAKGRGLARGVEFVNGEVAHAVCEEAYQRGLLVETSGPDGEVVKLLPPLTISDEELSEGLSILAGSVGAVVARTAHLLQVEKEVSA